MLVGLFLLPKISLYSPDPFFVCCIKLSMLLCVNFVCGIMSFGRASYIALMIVFFRELSS